MRLDILTGLMLGDGYIGYPNKGSKKPRLEIERTASEYDYHEWVKQNLLLEWKAEQDRKKANGYHGIKIKSSCDEQLKPIHDVWYVEGRRVIPYAWITKYFNKTSLAVWYMDDGHLSTRTRKWSPNSVSREITLCTQNFDIEELEWMVDFLENKFLLRFHIDGMGRLKLYRKEQIERFILIVQPTVSQIPSMIRKIRL